MTYLSDNSINRRVAFWNCAMRRFHDFVNDFDKDFVGKWPDNHDEQAMARTMRLLQDVEVSITTRYRDVLTEQIDAMCKQKQEGKA